MPQPLAPPVRREIVPRPQPKIHNPIKLTKEYMDNRSRMTKGEFEAGQRKNVLARFEKIEADAKETKDTLEQIKGLLTQLVGTQKPKE